LSMRATGLLILVMGIWGGLVPFVGPYFHFALGPAKSWTWTTGRLWLSVLPGAVAVLGGLLLLGAGRRPAGKVGALLALAAGIWFAVGPQVSLLWNASGAQGAAHGSTGVRVLEELTYHTLLGSLLAAVAGYALAAPLRRRTEAAADAEAAPAGETAAPVPSPARQASVERAAVPAAVAGSRPADEGSAVTRKHRVVGDEEPTVAAAEPRAGRVGVPGGVDARAETAHEPASPRGEAADGSVAAGRARENDEAAPAIIDRPTTSDGATADRTEPSATNGAAADDQRASATSTQNADSRSAPASEPPTSRAAQAPITVRRRRGGLLKMLRR